MRNPITVAALSAWLGGAAAAAELSATMQLATPEGPGATIGSVTIADSAGGAMLTADLMGLAPGEHGFHVHGNGDCGPSTNAQGQVVPAGAAGGHWDPEDTKRHEGPEGSGHLGDLPVLVVAADGTAKGSVTAPRITDVARIRGLALMIHAGGDNYSDQPAPLGGGGARVACGIIQ
jgi:Cu-Zn family superoxide dismutase